MPCQIFEYLFLFFSGRSFAVAVRSSQNFKRARNRWCLLVTLHNNPGLRTLRKQELEKVKTDATLSTNSEQLSAETQSDATLLYDSEACIHKAYGDIIYRAKHIGLELEFKDNPVFVSDEIEPDGVQHFEKY